MFEDFSDSPYALHLTPESFDLLPAEPEAGRDWTLAVYVEKDGKPNKSLQPVCHWRRVPFIPFMKPWKEEWTDLVTDLPVLAQLAAGASAIRAVRIAPAVPPGEHGRAGQQASENQDLDRKSTRLNSRPSLSAVPRPGSQSAAGWGTQ